MTDDRLPDQTRRKLLLGLTTAATVGLAGCGAGGDGDDGTDTETEAGDGTATETEAGDMTETETEPGDGTATETEAGDGTETETEPGDGTATETEAGDGTETETEPGDGTETATGEGMANLRVAHMSPNAPNVDVSVDGSTVLEDVPFGTVSDYLEVPSGMLEVMITPTGSDEAVFDDSIPVEADVDYTVVASGEVGDDADQPFEPLVLEDDNSDPGEDARLRAVHVSPDAPAVDITAGGGETVLFDAVEYGGSGYTTVPPGSYTVEIRADTSGNDGDVVADFDVELEGGQVYTAFAAGYLTPEDEPASTPFDLIVVQDTA